MTAVVYVMFSVQAFRAQYCDQSMHLATAQFGFDSCHGQDVFLFSITSKSAVEPPSLLPHGHWSVFLGSNVADPHPIQCQG
jgi:hypothetical protein